MEEAQPKKIKKVRKKSTKKVSEAAAAPKVKIHAPKKKKAYHLSDLSSYPLPESMPPEPTVALSAVTSTPPSSFTVSSWRSYVYVSVGVTFAFLFLLLGVWFLPVPEQYTAVADNQNLEQELEKIFMMPAERPVIATVTNAELLRNEQVFYMNAADGDTLFLFKEKRFAVLYRSSEHKIINASPVYLPGDVYISLSETKPEDSEDRAEEEVSGPPVLE